MIIALQHALVGSVLALPQQLVRLDKLLAERGAGSRKDVDRLIRNGLVELDGEIVGKSAAKLKVPWEACPIVDGFEYPPPPLLAVYHKPLGVVSSMKDDHGRPDLAAVLPQLWQKLLHPVGRLDADTTGLLLFSRDGDLTHRLLHPKYIVEREYIATVENRVDEEALRTKLASGVETVEEGESLIVRGELLSVESGVGDGEDEDGGESNDAVRLVVTEGKYRMVRRMLANCGHPVIGLHRVRYGEVRLEDLDVEEGESCEVEGDALEWAMGLRAAQKPQASASANEDTDEPPPPLDLPPSPPPLRAPSPPPTQGLSAEEAMEAAWRPKAADVALVMEEAGVEREEAIEALVRHKGDLVKALLDL